MAPNPINFDHHAHAPLDPDVRAALLEAFDTCDVNFHAASPTAERGRLLVLAGRLEAEGDLDFIDGEGSFEELVGKAAPRKRRPEK